MTYEELYNKAIENGCAPKLAELLASRSPPRCMTDAVAFEGIGTLAKQFEGDEGQLKRVIQEAKKKGFTPGVNDFYCATIANCVGDPEAFIPPTGGRNHMRRLAEKRGIPLEGAVTVKKPLYSEPTPDVPLQENYVREKMAAMVAADPKAARASKRELRKEIIRKHGGD